MKKGKKIMAGVMAVSLMLSGCSFSGLGGTEKNPPLGNGSMLAAGENGSADQGEVHYYRIDEYALANVDREVELLCDKGQRGIAGWGESDIFQIVGEKLYRPIEIVRWMDEEERAAAGLSENDPGMVSCGHYIQYLEPPYTKCENILLDGNWSEDGKWVEQKLRVTKDGRMLVLLKKEGSEEYATGEVKRDGTCVQVTDLAAVEAVENAEKELAEDSELYEAILAAGVSDLPVICADEESGAIYFSDRFRLWRYGETGSVKLLEYADQDVTMEAVRGMCVTGGGFLIMGGYKSNVFLLRLVEVSEPVPSEKQEVVLALPFTYPAIKEVVAGFNRKSRNYKVVFMQAPNSSEDGLANFRSEIQMQFSKGEGPDILSNALLWDYRSVAEKGFLARLDGFADDPEEFLPVAGESGVLNGVRYGLPVSGHIQLLAGSRELVGDRDSWTTEEMMKAVEASDAQWACYEPHVSLMNGADLVYYMGLVDNQNTAYIDWEAGESHLTEEPFLALMEFAKKYAGQPKDLSSYKHGAAVQEGKIALEVVNPNDVYDLQWFEECFNGDVAYIGYPGAEGSGVLMYTEDYYINASAKCPEGAKEFLRYLLTDEAQIILTTGEYGSGFPVRKDTLEANLKLLMKSGGTGGFSFDGISVMRRPFLKEDYELLMKLLLNAESIESNADGIRDILDEELAAYFSGDRTAIEVARILDNRVQLYLDERK